MNHVSNCADMRCDCEVPGPFNCGIPGILACLEGGRVAPGTRVERCDACQRFSSDEAARARLQALGLVDAQVASNEQTYTVHCFAVVGVTLQGIAAGDYREAAKLAAERFDWDRHRDSAEFAGDFDEFVVELDGGAEHCDSKRFTGHLKEVTV